MECSSVPNVFVPSYNKSDVRNSFFSSLKNMPQDSDLNITLQSKKTFPRRPCKETDFSSTSYGYGTHPRRQREEVNDTSLISPVPILARKLERTAVSTPSE
eukprot:2788835-Ditylum_brightwellii.AAC.1